MQRRSCICIRKGKRALMVADLIGDDLYTQIKRKAKKPTRHITIQTMLKPRLYI